MQRRLRTRSTSSTNISRRSSLSSTNKTHSALVTDSVTCAEGITRSLPGRQRQRERMRHVWLHVDDAQLVFDRRKTDAAERNGRRSIARREILVNQPCARLIQLNQHGARTALPRQCYCGGALLLQREAVLLARVALDVTGSRVVRERPDSGVNHLLRRHKAGGNVWADGVGRRGRDRRRRRRRGRR